MGDVPAVFEILPFFVHMLLTLPRCSSSSSFFFFFKYYYFFNQLSSRIENQAAWVNTHRRGVKQCFVNK